MTYIEAQGILNKAKELKTEGFDLLLSIFAQETAENIECIYHFCSTINNQEIILKTKLDKNNPRIESISSLYKTADWNERETFDLFGVEFLNHPNLKRILLPNDWKGHPLRKDYKQDDERLSWNER
ncbi:MAG: NADH-quinone oxidoreductase subunit C [Candidatus Gastranaerophilales bacterium]|nr:NADH-quinone oxidoreductase subunit C [Candidatus Gastranaerophilales bacterium]